MKESSLYNIRQISMKDLLHQSLEDAGSEKEYLVYWWNEIPLGHRWVEILNEKESSNRKIWETISATLNFYCSSSEEIDFKELASAWEKEDYYSCLQLLNSLFEDYACAVHDKATDLTLVICTRNRSTHLKNCLDSLSGLSVQPKEIIVVDNAPDDYSTRELVAGYPFVKYVLEPDKGLDRARNTGWHHATSSIVAYADDDVRLHKDWVWQTIGAFDHPRVMGVTGLVFAEELNTEAQAIFEKYWPFNRGYQDIYYDTDYFRKHLKKGVPAWDVGAGANMAFRRSALEAAGDFDNRLDVGASGCSGDSEMWYRLMAEGWTIHYTPRAITYHTHRKEMKSLRSQIYYYMRGSTSSLLVQYQRYRHWGNLHHLYISLPEYYVMSLLRKIRYPHAKRYNTLMQEILGSLSGVCYFLIHRKIPSETRLKNNHTFSTQKHTVSVIITTYNHARYIEEAIDSALNQTFQPLEIIVVDDGSTDNTEYRVSQYSQVKYIKQRNKGLAAARNTGVFNSHGNYIVFLDADDLLYPHAIAKNLNYYEQYPACAFISGWHDKVDQNKKLIETYEDKMPEGNHYQALLRGNYIGMHAAVMYRREVFASFLFDETLPACEDYDLYLRIAKKYPVFSHNEKLAAYRMHPDNMSKDINLMLRQVKVVLRKNTDLNDVKSRENYRMGKANWKAYYAREMYRRIAYRYLYPEYNFNLNNFFFVTANLPRRMVQLFIHKLTDMFGRKNKMVPKPGNIHFGEFRRTEPISKEFGYDRGGPVDRYYIENFLKENEAYIKANVLEIGDNAYTMAYGGGRVSKSDILFIDDSNPNATIIGDLSAADNIPDDQFDCIILTQTLHLIYDFHSAIKHCYRILKPGGVLLLTVPGITQIDYGEWGDTWYWSFTGRAIQKLLSAYFDPADLLVQTHGNVLVATAFLYGLGQNEITDKEKDENDPHYQVIITARAMKR